MSQVIANRVRTLEVVAAGRPAPLQVLALVAPAGTEPEYELLDREHVSAVRIDEVSDAGTVPNLRVENSLDARVFMMDGQELVGAKQNRILNTDILVPARTTIIVPVSCVEEGRWRHLSPHFEPGRSATYLTRSTKLASVSDSLRRVKRHDADQGAVWGEVRACLDEHMVSSPTVALNDAYAARDEQLQSFRESVELPDTAVGVAVFQDGSFRGLDLFDRPSTFRHFRDLILDSYAIDLCRDRTSPSRSASPAALTRVLEQAASAGWTAFDAPGEGRDHRLETDDLVGSALVWEERAVVHLQLFSRTSGPVERDER